MFSCFFLSCVLVLFVDIFVGFKCFEWVLVILVLGLFLLSAPLLLMTACLPQPYMFNWYSNGSLLTSTSISHLYKNSRSVVVFWGLIGEKNVRCQKSEARVVH